MMGTDEDKWASLAAELGLADAPPSDEPAAKAAPAKRGRSPRRSSPRKRPVVEETAPPLPITEDIMEEGMVTEDVLTADGEGPAKKRRRRRSRKKKGTAEGTLPSNGETAVAVLDDDDSADVAPAEWKMPTWQELIDSLHRQ